MRSSQKTSWLAALTIAAAGIVQAQVPPEIAKELVAIGRAGCIAQTAKIYRPLQPNPPYPGISITRDISFGPDPKDVLDLFAQEKGSRSRPVLIYVPGGPGNRRQAGSGGDVFYDNILVWAAKQGMVGLNMQRHPGRAWDDPAKAVGLLLQWVNRNIARYQGNPARVFIWAQSLGNDPVSTYISHPELYGPQGVGLKGAIFMSPTGFNILPATPPPAPAAGPCMDPTPDAAGAAPAARNGGGKGRGKGKGKAPAGQAKETAPRPDAATELARSNLPGLIGSKLPFIVSHAELDPPGVVAFAETLKEQLCKGGHCPTYLVFKDHGHISQVMSPGTADTSVTGPILKWIKSVK